MRTDDVVVLVPVYNEAARVATVVADLRSRFANVLCVDDGSTDGSARLAREAGATVIRHSLNLGQGAALRTGFEYLARRRDAEWIVTFDADAQHLVSDAEALVARGRADDLDVVLASRFAGATEDMPRMRGRVLKAAVAYTRWTTGLAVTDTHNGLRAIHARALGSLMVRQPRMAYASELLSAIATHELRYTEVPTTVVYSDYSRGKGQRNINAVNILFDLAMARLRAIT